MARKKPGSALMAHNRAAPTGGKVVVAYVHPTEVTIGFHESIISTLLFDVARERRLFNGGGRLNSYSSANVSNSRNSICNDFLDKWPGAEWLWMVDADMVFGPDTLYRLLGNADKDKAPIVGGLCYGVSDGELFPTLYGLDRNEERGVHTIRYDTFPKDAMFQVAATGAACLLIHRSALAAMREKAFSKPYPFFQETELNGDPVGEDVTFCFRAGKLGLPIWIDTSVQIGHQKTFIADHDRYIQQVGDPHVLRPG